MSKKTTIGEDLTEVKMQKKKKRVPTKNATIHRFYCIFVFII